MNIDEIFNNTKLTENGDLSYTKASDDVLLNILFLTEYYQKHIDELPEIGSDDESRLFAMFVRDPRYGLGRRDLGRALMYLAGCSISEIVNAGRVDDLFYMSDDEEFLTNAFDWCRTQIINGNELVKKWMPRYSSKNLMLARYIARYWGLNKQQYGHFIKCNTVENKMSRHNYDEIEFEHVPSLAMIKYATAFGTKPETAKRYIQYLSDVRSGKKEMKISTTTVYDIYKNRNRIDADLFFDKIEKVSGSWIPIVDTSGSMVDSNDSYGKALAIGHYLAKCSSYCPNKVLSFSSCPKLITLGVPSDGSRLIPESLVSTKDSAYCKEIISMHTGDWTNTDFGMVMQLLSNLDKDLPEWLVVLSDMEFDAGSKMSKDATMQLFKEKGYNTRIVWWNLNSRNITSPEMDSDGNIFLSGYNPMLLKYLQVGFDGKKFLNELLKEYKENIAKSNMEK